MMKSTVNMILDVVAIDNDNTLVCAMYDHLGFANDKLTAKDFDTKADFQAWKDKVNVVRSCGFELEIARKNNAVLGEKNDMLYTALKDLFKTFDIKCKLDSKTAFYLASKSMKVGTGKSVNIQKIESEIRDYRKQEKTAKRPDMFKRQIEDLQEELKALKSVSGNMVKIDAIQSESVFRKVLEDYIACRVAGIATTTN